MNRPAQRRTRARSRLVIALIATLLLAGGWFATAATAPRISLNSPASLPADI